VRADEAGSACDQDRSIGAERPVWPIRLGCALRTAACEWHEGSGVNRGSIAASVPRRHRKDDQELATPMPRSQHCALRDVRFSTLSIRRASCRFSRA
jgi:hypothetical protein